MKKLLFVLSVIAMLSLLAAPALAASDMTCDHNGTTIESLHHCVLHAYDMGHIDNKGVAQSLMAKLESAQAALDRGQTRVAVNKLNAFINEVNAQSGKHIAADHAPMLADHAQKVIDTLLKG